MTIGSQLRDLYIAGLEKNTNSPYVSINKEMQKNEHIQMMLAEAHASLDMQFTLAAFTVDVKKEPPDIYALHIYARALKGETVGGKQRPEGAQRKFLKAHHAAVTLLATKKFSANPQMNDKTGITMEVFAELMGYDIS